jgi:ketopantoate reductase
MGENTSVKIEVYQQDWMPGFGAFLDDGSIHEEAKAHIAINLGGLLCAVEYGDIPREELPYTIAETIMHEVFHALEAWAEVEFDDERVEELLEQYRKKYGKR